MGLWKKGKLTERERELQALVLRYHSVSSRYDAFLKLNPGSLFWHLSGNWLQNIIGAIENLKEKFSVKRLDRLRSNLERLERYYDLLDQHPALLSLNVFEGMVTEEIFEYLESQI